MNGDRGGNRVPLSAVLIAVITGIVAGVVAVGVGLFALFGESRLGQVAEFGFLVATLAAATAAGVVWVVRARPGVVASVAVLFPFVVAWVLFVPWYRVRFPVGYIGWTAAGLVALAVLTVWFVRYSRGRARRLLIFICGLLVLFAANGAGLAAVVWRNTNAFGLRGHPAPWTAFDTLASASCLSNNRFHHRGEKLVESRCPSGPDAEYYSGIYDVSEFDNTLCAEQPRAAFAKWWDWNRQYRIEFTLDFRQGSTVVDGRRLGPPYPTEIGGDAATVIYDVRLVSALRSKSPASQRVRFLTSTETWTVTLGRVALGGWKVCQIAISDPIDAIQN